MRAALIIAALALTGCATRVVEVEATQDTAAPVAAPAVTAAPVTAKPQAPSQAEYERALDYFTGYCWSDCTQEHYDRWEYHLELADREDLRSAVVAMATMSYAEVDGLCDEFWQDSDADVVDMFDGYDSSAILTAFYYVCDT